MNEQRPLRVLYVLKRFPQTSQTFIVREIIGLERAGVDVGVDALSPEPGSPRHPEFDLVRAAVRYVPRRRTRGDWSLVTAHIRCALRWPHRYLPLALKARRRDGQGWRRFRQAAMVADRVRRERVDVIHAHFATAAAEVASDAAALSGCAFTVTAHAKDIFSDSHSSALADRVARAAAVLTVSNYNVEYLRSVLHDLPVHLVYNAVGSEPVIPRPKGGPVLCIARLVDKKGIDTLLRAVAEVRVCCPGLRLEIVGDGEQAAPLNALAVELGIAELVTFLGARSSTEVDAAYRRCAMFVLACRISADGDRDGMPTVIIEALARAIPVISTDVVGIPEVIVDGSSGLLVAPDDVASLANAIEKLWADPALGADLGAAGWRMVAERFAPASSAEQLRALFSSVAGSRR